MSTALALAEGRGKDTLQMLSFSDVHVAINLSDLANKAEYS